MIGTIVGILEKIGIIYSMFTVAVEGDVWAPHKYAYLISPDKVSRFIVPLNAKFDNGTVGKVNIQYTICRTEFYILFFKIKTIYKITINLGDRIVSRETSGKYHNLGREVQKYLKTVKPILPASYFKPSTVEEDENLGGQR